MKPLADLLQQSAALHRHLCPRQVLGVRMGILAGRLLGLDLPQAPSGKRLLTIVETDGCAADGVSVATNCWVGRRTLRVVDIGKVAATFVDTHTALAVRIVPRSAVRGLAREYAPDARNKWEEQLLGYQQMPDDQLLLTNYVTLTTPLAKVLSRPGVKAICEICGEEILNEREIVHEGTTLCRACAGQGYYRLVGTSLTLRSRPRPPASPTPPAVGAARRIRPAADTPRPV